MFRENNVQSSNSFANMTPAHRTSRCFARGPLILAIGPPWEYGMYVCGPYVMSFIYLYLLASLTQLVYGLFYAAVWFSRFVSVSSNFLLTDQLRVLSSLDPIHSTYKSHHKHLSRLPLAAWFSHPRVTLRLLLSSYSFTKGLSMKYEARACFLYGYGMLWGVGMGNCSLIFYSSWLLWCAPV